MLFSFATIKCRIFSMRKIYPEIEPYKVHNLKVSDIHTLYVEESGNPKGIPIIHLHGGPGSSAKPKKRRLYNPQKYRIILMDQRGCGRSTPQGEIKENNTQALIEDMEKIRTELQIEKWHILGGSWGSCLALAYAETHPDRVSALILQGVFTFRQRELDWLNKFGANEIFPDIYEKVVDLAPPAYKDNPITYFLHQVLSGTNEEALAATNAMGEWESNISELIPQEDEDEIMTDEEAVNSNLVYANYETNHGFLKEEELIANASKLREIPGVIIQGRYDMVCPMKTAWDLHRAWPEAEFHIIPDAGHASDQPGTLEKILEYTEKFAEL